MEKLTVKELFNLNETIAKDLLNSVTYPWEALPKISAFIVELGETLDEEKYEKRDKDIWIAKNATVATTAYIHGPAIDRKSTRLNSSHSSVSRMPSSA